MNAMGRILSSDPVWYYVLIWRGESRANGFFFASARILIPEMPCIRQTEPSIPTPATNQRSRFLEGRGMAQRNQLTGHNSHDLPWRHSGRHLPNILFYLSYWLSAFRETSNHNLICKADTYPTRGWTRWWKKWRDKGTRQGRALCFAPTKAFAHRSTAPISEKSQ
jgi:hypothetical protein